MLSERAEFAIRVEHMSKEYRLGRAQEFHDTLRDHFSAGLRSLGQRRAPYPRAAETLWALKDVSCDVKRGEVLGIIGRNGAGKSTLLKILSRITEPTSGHALLHGRVGSLLEVGTGFHPELSGRENIYLNGAILGMKRAEIARKFDEIVAFAETEKFLDTPVKRYSSGMYVRLAFAVAAHLEPEILLVDEVLAVGDAAFQKKCLGKMGDAAREGRTILFVSHDMTNISVLCHSVLFLESGEVRMRGPTRQVIECYMSAGAPGRSRVRWDHETAPGDDLVRIWAVETCRTTGSSADSFALTDPITFVIEYAVERDGSRLNPVFILKNALGLTVFSTANYEDAEWGVRQYKAGVYRAVCRVPGHLLNVGTYRVDAALIQETRFVRAIAQNAVEFEVYDDGVSRGGYLGPWDGLVRPRCEWSASAL